MKRLCGLLALFMALSLVGLTLPSVTQAGGRHRHFRDGHHRHSHRPHHRRHHRHRSGFSTSITFGSYWSHPPGPGFYVTPDPVYVIPSYRTTVPPAISVEPEPQAATQQQTSCLQEREYQTKIIIDGNEVDAYGTACLQPDGSWRRGPMQLPR